MKAITMYESSDGSRFTTPQDAEERDLVIRRVDEAMIALPKLPDDGTCNFANGSGFIQHSPEAVRAARLALYEIAKGPLAWWIKDQKAVHGKTDEDLALRVHPSWLGRMLDGACPPLEKALVRIMCIDDKAREWGQPFYALNPDEAIAAWESQHESDDEETASESARMDY